MKTKDKKDTAWLYEGHREDYHLTYEEEQIMKQMRKLNTLWKKYKSLPGGNRLILFCGGTGCEIRIDRPIADNEIESYPDITCDGGDGGDNF